MRFLLKVGMDTAIGNRLAKEGQLGARVKAILQDIKPEAAYFGAENGKRTAFLIIDMKDASQMPAIAEPFFQSFNATIEQIPVMTPEDLAKGEPGIAAAAKAHG